MKFSQPIAIVGMGGIFPGASTLGQFWNNIVNGIDAAKEVPAGRWLLRPEDALDSKPATPDKVYSSRGCFIEGFKLDATGLDLSPEFLAGLDPLFHLILHAGRAAFDDASMMHIERSRIGVILGNIALPTESSSAWGEQIFRPLFEEQLFGENHARISPVINPINRYVAGLPAGVLAKALGLGGGSCTLDAACASSLYALKLACDELLAGRADAMLTGGASRPDCLYTQMGFSQLRALSPTGQCSPFDANGNGLVVGEGAGIVVLKRLADAVRDGDHIYAVIRGIGLSNDVEGNLLAPSSEGQLRALRQAYEQAGWTPDAVDLIECHATGTPVGDAVEFESLKRLWSDARWLPAQCVLGGVKSNIGHLLTGAGAAGLIKVLLALKEKMLPPTANFSKAGEKIALAESPFQILAESKPWNARSPKTPRRAAVSAFGFGGINAHVLIEEWTEKRVASRAPKTPTKHKPNPIAIVGMDACFGPWRDLRAFQERVLGGGNNEQPQPPKRWWGVAADGFKGYFLDELNIPTDRYRIPPKELEEMLPQQLIMLQVAAGALRDAQSAEMNLLRTGVFIGIGLDLATTHFHFRWSLLKRAREWAKRLGVPLSEVELERWVSSLREASGPALNANRTMGALGGIVASRLAREFRIGGPSHTISSEESSGIRALEAAVRALQQGELDHALVGAVDLAGDIRSVLGTHAGRPFSPQGKARPFDTNADGTIPGEGAAAIVLKRLADAVRDGDRIYAVIQGMGVATGGGAENHIPTADAYKLSLQRAYADAGVRPNSVDYLEAHGSGFSEEDQMEGSALASFFEKTNRASVIKLGSAKESIGHIGAAAGLAALVKTSLCLYQEILPPLREIENVQENLASAKGRFALPTAPQYWLRDRQDGPRRAGVSSFSLDGNCTHVVLEAFEDQETSVTILERRQPLGARSEALFAVTGEDTASLSRELERLSRWLKIVPADGIELLARKWWRQNKTEERGRFAVSLCARDATELLQLAESARQALVENPTQRIGANSRNGARGNERIFFSPEPLAAQGHIAFIFPGSGNHYPDMGRELAWQWPEILRAQDRQNQRLASQMVPDSFWSDASRASINNIHQAMIFGQVSLGTMVSDLTRHFGIEPGAVIGYSLGESAGLFSLHAWKARDEMFRRMKDSSLFTSDLAGACDAVRQTWNLSANAQVDWILGVIDRPAEEVREALRNRSRVYLLIVNTPQECVIGGEHGAVDSLVAELGCKWFPIHGVTTVHCEVARPVEKPYRDLHLFPTTPPPGVRFYSGAAGCAYAVNRESAAHSVVTQALVGVDYPKVIEAAYADGARLFLEMGPGATCSRMIGRILEGRPHLARAACFAGQNPLSQYLRFLGQLITEGVPVNLETLYGQPTCVVGHRETAPGAGGKFFAMPLGGKPFVVPRPQDFQSPNRERNAETVAEIPRQRARALTPARQLEPVAIAHTADPLVSQMATAESARASAHETYLRFSQNLFQTMSQNLAFQISLLETMKAGGGTFDGSMEDHSLADIEPGTPMQTVALNREQCLEFAIGSIGKTLGAAFAEVDSFPTRVRLPDEPLMLVDRILSVEGEPRSMTSGRVVTEHDVHPDAWYLDAGRIPTCIAVEAGQADLFLSGFLGIDFETRGRAVYRLLDAVVTFHRGLPGPGEVIHYDIRINEFFRQGSTWLFRFSFEGTVNGQPLLTMTKGCAGFFTAQELDAGKGIVQTALDRQPVAGKRPEDWDIFVPMAVESYSDSQINSLRSGDLASCFGAAFAGLPLQRPLTLPSGRMKLVDRVLHLDPHGGRFGLGLIRAEADIHPDDWFLTCHFVDDRVMPGTLMFECCLHTLRIYLLRLGWVLEADGAAPEPVPGVASQLKCRGQVIESTAKVLYEISVKELGYRPEPYAIVDALMYADGKPIVEITNMSIRFAGATREQLRATWAGQSKPGRKPALFDSDRILDFAIGKPSEAFGEPYKIFDQGRKIARLPGPPYQFLDRITEIRAEPWKLVAGGVIEAQYDVPPDAWYFAENRQGDMPFAVLLEIALQPCGWLAAYLGSALTSEIDLSFRNLGGTATQFVPVRPDAGTLTTTVKITRVANSGGMIIQHFDYEVRSATETVYRGNTYFGFFSKAALSEQVGIRDAKPYQPTTTELARGRAFDFPTTGIFPGAQIRMVDRVTHCVPDGGSSGLGFIRGTKRVNPDEWFFKAHFFEDPVCPGSLGLESFLQLLKVLAVERWGEIAGARLEAIATGERHEWTYRGQIIPTDREVVIEAVVTAVDDTRRLIRADGYLFVDGRTIYGMKDFTVRCQEH